MKEAIDSFINGLALVIGVLLLSMYLIFEFNYLRGTIVEYIRKKRGGKK